MTDIKKRLMLMWAKEKPGLANFRSESLANKVASRLLENGINQHRSKTEIFHTLLMQQPLRLSF